MNDRKDYIRQLEETIRKFLEPIEGIPFPIAIRALTGCEVLSFDKSLKENQTLIEKLSKACETAGRKAYEKGIFTDRPNEAGNQIEPFVLEALREVGLNAERPKSKSGRKKLAGYPDIEIQDEFGRTTYLECKTYNSKSKNQSFRTFYFSPSSDSKITKDAFHLLMSFELEVSEREKRKALVPVSWQIYTLDKLLIQVKHEFNASNRELYTYGALIAEGKIK